VAQQHFSKNPSGRSVYGKKAGNETNFDFAFFAQSKVMKLDSNGLNSPFNGIDILKIRKR